MLSEKGESLVDIADALGVPAIAEIEGGDLAERVRRLKSAAASPFVSDSNWYTGKPAAAASFVRAATLGILGGGATCQLTQGGTESGLLALFAAREAYAHVADPEILIPWSAHPLFEKAGRYLKLRVRRIAETPDHRVDVAAMEAAITPSTIALVGSFPAWPFGVIDPLPEIGALAERRGLWFHVDGSIGGLLFPFLEGAPDWAKAPMRLPGVRSISADHHKYGYAPTGLSAVCFRHERDSIPAYFQWTDWPGLPYATESIAGTRAAAPMMGAAAVMRYLGAEGYRVLAAEHRLLSRRIGESATAHAGWRVEGTPDGGTLSLVADKPDVDKALQLLSSEGRVLRYTLAPYGVQSYANPVNPADVGFPAQLARVLDKARAA